MVVVPSSSAPVGEEKGGSLGSAKVHPVCVSSASSGRVRFQVGCVIDSPMASSKPCAGRGAGFSTHAAAITHDPCSSNYT
jgi:hypothetical protein